jgi:hypothetical protein
MHARGGEGVVREQRDNATVLLRGQLTTPLLRVGMVTGLVQPMTIGKYYTLQNHTFKYMARYNK